MACRVARAALVLPLLVSSSSSFLRPQSEISKHSLALQVTLLSLRNFTIDVSILHRRWRIEWQVKVECGAGEKMVVVEARADVARHRRPTLLAKFGEHGGAIGVQNLKT